MKKIYTSHSASHTQEIAREFGGFLRGGDVVTLSGELGAGKTTFCQSLLQSLGATGPYTSPTFLIMKEYALDADTPGPALGIQHVYHVDAYRIKSEDMVELGWYDLIARKDVLIIVEWPEMIASILPQDVKTIELEHIDENTRQITIV